MPIDETTTFEVSTHGDIAPEVIDRARERLGRIGRHCREPITHVDLRVTDDLNHPAQPHARAEASLVVKHGPVRAHAQSGTVAEAVDLMIERLRRRVDRHQEKLHRIGTKKHDGVAEPGSWKHGDVDSAPRHVPAVAAENARVVRRKSFAPAPMSVAEALFDVEILDHDFYLFEETETGATCLVTIGADSTVALSVDGETDPVVPSGIARVPGPIVLDEAGAQRLLVGVKEPFVFHRTNPGAPAQVMYRRYDGDFGVIGLDD